MNCYEKFSELVKAGNVGKDDANILLEGLSNLSRVQAIMISNLSNNKKEKELEKAVRLLVISTEQCLQSYGTTLTEVVDTMVKVENKS